jgi:hypothetical protein
MDVLLASIAGVICLFYVFIFMKFARERHPHHPR